MSAPSLCLLVLGERSLATHALPNSGALVLGRGLDCDVVVDEDSLAMRHAQLRIGNDIRIENVAETATLWVQGQRVPPGTAPVIRPGDVFRLGDVNFVLQRRQAARPRRIWTHGYFESRLEEECIRAERYASEFALLRIRCPATARSEDLEETLANVLRNVDIVGSYGPGEYEVLLVDTPPSGAQLVQSRLSRALAARNVHAMIGVANYPQDGSTPDVLAAEAGVRARGESEAAPAPQARLPAPLPGESAVPLKQIAERIASSAVSILLLGETGVGKEKMAERIHALSPRREAPFIRVNGAALSTTLLENDLFGVASPDAVSDKRGLLEHASGGTLFLDEVGELPLSVQDKLLGVMESGRAQRVGGHSTFAVDIRFMAATHRDLEAEVRRGAFLQGLYAKLNGVSVVIPPLRERVSELPALAKHFVAEACRRNGRANEPELSAQALQLIQTYSWPGNLRELRNVLERAVILCPSGPILQTHLPVERMHTTFVSRNVPAPPARLFTEGTPKGTRGGQQPGDVTGLTPKELTERKKILDALDTCAGNQTEAAKSLGISRRTLVNRLGRYKVPRPRKKRRQT